MDVSQSFILVIDDEKPVREAIGDILALEGGQAIGAPDGETGIALYRERQAEIRLIILDLSMPGLSSEETLLELRKINPEVPVLLSSGYSEVEVVDRFADFGAVGFLQKPYKINRLLEVVRACMA